MKSYSTPSLVLYFLSCISFVLFNFLHMDNCVLISKSVIIPAIFFYYFTENHYKIKWIPLLILIFCFAGDVYILLDQKENLIASVYCFLIVYLLLLCYVLQDFSSTRLRRNDVLPILFVTVFFIYLLVTVLSLQFKSNNSNAITFIIYGITLTILSCFAVANYVAKGSYAYLNMVVTTICFLISDIFYALNHFFLALPILEIITIATQVLSYYFMIKYFLLRKKSAPKEATDAAI